MTGGSPRLVDTGRSMLKICSQELLEPGDRHVTVLSRVHWDVEPPPPPSPVSGQTFLTHHLLKATSCTPHPAPLPLCPRMSDVGNSEFICPVSVLAVPTLSATVTMPVTPPQANRSTGEVPEASPQSRSWTLGGQNRRHHKGEEGGR